MLLKSQRLNLKEKFKWVVSGKKVSTPTLNIFYRFGENTKPLIGIATSKKITPKAHERNYVKRFISSVIKEFYNGLPNNLNLVIIPKGGILKINKIKLKDELNIIKSINSENN